jgi:hypothetical protein
VHFQVRIAPQFLHGYKRVSMIPRRPFFRAPIFTSLPGFGDHICDLGVGAFLQNL